jgi:hypothetical protein
VQIIELKRFGGAPHHIQFAPQNDYYLLNWLLAMSKMHQDFGYPPASSAVSFSFSRYHARLSTDGTNELIGKCHAVFVWLINYKTVVFFSQNKPPTSNQPSVLFTQNKSALAINHQPNKHGIRRS